MICRIPVLMLQHSIAFKSSDELERSYWLARSPGLAPASDWSLSPAGILNQLGAPPAVEQGWEGGERSIVRTVQPRHTKNNSDYIMWSRCCHTLDSQEINSTLK